MPDETNPTQAPPHDPYFLEKTVLSISLMERFGLIEIPEGPNDERSRRPPYKPGERLSVIIDLNLGYPLGRERAWQRVIELLGDVCGVPKDDVANTRGWSKAREERVRKTAEDLDERKILAHRKSELVGQYVFADLTREQVQALVERDRREEGDAEMDGDDGETAIQLKGAIYKIWEDFQLEAQIDRSVATIKCDAARISFSAGGAGITWAVVDSGIDGEHPHFRLHDNLRRSENCANDPICHEDFTGEGDPLRDEFGHGTHVAGILAGEFDRSALARRARAEARAVQDDSANSADPADPADPAAALLAVRRVRDEGGDVHYRTRAIDSITGMAPETRLLSLKVLDAEGSGNVSNILAAIAHIQNINGHGRHLKIHGVNLSLGYPFNPRWFACGQSPFCVEVDRLVRSGVVVVAAAGNSGFGYNETLFRGVPQAAGLGMTINDPGNAEAAITIGSTHRDAPHTYGVSYFSSKGPTGDGRLKPDLLAPGEKILSCAAGGHRQRAEERLEAPGAEDKGSSDSVPIQDGPVQAVHYVEQSGTSMAAPHVSGAIAAFLSIRREFIGKPRKIKKIFLENATDLGRERYFQGHGLLDLMRTIQGV